LGSKRFWEFRLSHNLKEQVNVFAAYTVFVGHDVVVIPERMEKKADHQKDRYGGFFNGALYGLILIECSLGLCVKYSVMALIINTIIDLKFGRVFLASEVFGGEKPVGSRFEGAIRWAV